MSSLGDRLRGLGQDALAVEADRLEQALEAERTTSRFWHERCGRLETELSDLYSGATIRLRSGDTMR